LELFGRNESTELASRFERDSISRVTSQRRPVGITLLIIFFAVGALICLVTMLALAFPGGLLEPIWRLKPERRVEFQELGEWSIALMAAVGVACGLAAVGLAKNAEWGRRLAIGILTVNLIGDSLNALFRHDLRTLIGLPIGGLMIFYLLKQRRAQDECANARSTNI
jgi:H+/Cl- antiporter ClcA